MGQELVVRSAVAPAKDAFVAGQCAIIALQLLCSHTDLQWKKIAAAVDGGQRFRASIATLAFLPDRHWKEAEGEYAQDLLNCLIDRYEDLFREVKEGDEREKIKALLQLALFVGTAMKEMRRASEQTVANRHASTIKVEVVCVCRRKTVTKEEQEVLSLKGALCLSEG